MDTSRQLRGEMIIPCNPPVWAGYFVIDRQGSVLGCDAWPVVAWLVSTKDPLSGAPLPISPCPESERDWVVCADAYGNTRAEAIEAAQAKATEWKTVAA